MTRPMTMARLARNIARKVARTGARLLVPALLIAGGYALGMRQGVSLAQSEDLTIPPEGQELLAPVWQAFTIITNAYVDPEGDLHSTRDLIDGAIVGMVATLDDPGSVYFDADSLQRFNQRVAGETTGFGIRVSTNEATGRVALTEVVNGSPADAAGLQVGDVISGINGENVSDWKQGDIIARLQASGDQPVQFTVQRGDETVEITVTRGVIVTPSVETDVLEGDDGDVGYIHLARFSEAAVDEFYSALDRFAVEDIEGLVVDLRGNVGGQLGATVDIASTFIDEGIVLVEDLGRREEVFEARGGYRNLDIPVVVLVNGQTQSAAETFAGALQDYGAATILGETTFGKGTVQTLQPLVNGGGLRVTIGQILTPDRESYNGIGIVPDVIVPAGDGTTDTQLDAAIDYIQSQAQAS